jgi:uncharacterized protein (DUF305 family)
VKKLSTLIITALATFSLPACSDDQRDGHGHDAATPEIAESEEFNGADVQFATKMIQHHAQALAMVDLTRERELSPSVQELADQVLAAQGPEIELMTDLLTEWDQPVPETVRDHANAHGDGGTAMDPDTPGSMSEEDMAELENAGDADFERMWLEMMIEHHEGAIEMAESEQQDGEHEAAVDLAGTIVSTQRAEVDRMEELLDS